MDEVNPQEIILASDDLSKLTKGHAVNGRRKMGRMANHSSSHDKLTMAQIKAQIALYWKKGDSYLDICEKVSDEFGLKGDDRLNPNNAHYHIRQMMEYWKEVGLLNIDEKYAIALARWEQIEALATEAYFNSMRGKSTRNYERQIERARSKDREKSLRADIEEERQEAIKEGRKPRIHQIKNAMESLVAVSEKIKEYERHEDNLAGNPQFLRLLFDINDRRCKMWNLYASKKDMASPDQDMARLPDEERESRLKAILMSALNRKRDVKMGLAEPAPLGGFADKDLPKPAQIRAEGIPMRKALYDPPPIVVVPKYINLENEDF